MKKYYSEPEVVVRKYVLSTGSVTTSDPENNEDNDLFKDDEVDFFK